jgi:hypothetical protein
MMINRAKKKRMAAFATGAEALRVPLDRPSADLYGCPICGRLFTKVALSNGALTLEHVPPKSLGGKALLLTCKECNSTAGHTIDASADREEKVKRFGRALSGEGEIEGQPSKFTMLGEELNATIAIDGEGRRVTVRVDRELNDPEAIGRIIAAAERSAHGKSPEQEEFQGNITPRLRWKPRHARISDLRSAFLLSFAYFGYGYAFHPNLAQVREQIRFPDREILPGAFWLEGEEVSSTDVLHLGLTERPLEALLVHLRGMTYILPVPWGPQDFYAEAARALRDRQNITALRIPVPTEMQMVLDLRGGS